VRGHGKKPASRWLGLKVQTTEGRPYGEVVGVYEFGAGEVLDIQIHLGKKIVMLPLKDQFLQLSKDGSHLIVQAFEFNEAKPE